MYSSINKSKINIESPDVGNIFVNDALRIRTKSMPSFQEYFTAKKNSEMLKEPIE